MQGIVYSIWGPKENSGATFTAINLANALSKYKNKVLLVDLDYINPNISDYLMMEEDGHFIDNLNSFALAGNLNSKAIEVNCVKKDNLYILKGTINPSFTDFTPSEIVSSIIDSLREDFSYVILDVNSSINNTGTYVALKKADKVFTVLNKNVIDILFLAKELNFFEKLDIDTSKFEIIFNNDSNIYIEEKDILDRISLNKAASLPVINDSVNYVNKGELSKLMISRNSKKYNKMLEKFIKEKILEDNGAIPIKKK